MSSHGHHGHGVIDALKSAANAVKKSPGMLRKKFNGKKQMGESKEYSALDNCRENGWLHPDDAIRLGVEYNVKYLGSVEIDYVPGNPSENNALALKTMRYLKKSASKESIQTLKLTISIGRISLTSPDHTKIVMRHSTSRIAYSTVDHEHPKHFCYVALPKTSSMPLLHMFITKSAKTSYELTFTCAQAFDANYKQWQSNRTVAETKSLASESGDVEPSRAHRSPLVQRKAMNSSPAPGQQSLKKPSPLHGAATLAVPDSGEGTNASPASPASTWQSGDRIASADDGEVAATLVPFSLLEVDDDETDADKYFASLSAAKSTPNMLDIGVDPEDFNKAKDDYIDIDGAEDD